MSFEVQEFNIKDNRIKKESHFVILSDLHGRSYGNKNESLVTMIGYFKPDAVMILGDMMSCRSKETYFGSLGMYKLLAAKYPCYFVNGNHEEYNRVKRPTLYKKYMLAMKQSGVNILSNSSVLFQNTGICLHGLRLPFKSYVKFANYNFNFLNFKKIFTGLDNKYYNVLLSHNPYVVKTKNNFPFDLVLSGHMHGGGIRFPLVGAIIGPNLLPFPRLTKGFYELENTKLIVSTGLGDHFPMIRLNNPRMFVSVKLSPIREK